MKGGLTKDEDGEVHEIDIEFHRESYQQFSRMIQIVSLVESGTVSFTFEEYKRLPFVLSEVLRLYKIYKAKKKST